MATSGISVEQVQTHLSNLADSANFRIFHLLVETALFAIFTVLIITSSYILITRGLHSRSNKVVLIVTLVMYALSTFDWALDIHFVRNDLKIYLFADLEQPPRNEIKRMKVDAALKVAQSITNNICTFLSDIVVCWRVYVVWGHNKRVLAVAIALLTALGSGLILCNLTQVGVAFHSVTNLHKLAPGELEIDIVTLIFSALVNIWATLMIAYRAWQCRQEIRRFFKKTSNRTFTESILTLFVETGAIYTILWILKNIIVLPVVEDTAYTDYAGMVMFQMTGMYPTVIIILVTLKKSHLEDQFTYPGSAGADVTLPFAARAQESSTWATTNQDLRQHVSVPGISFGQNSSRSFSDGDLGTDKTSAVYSNTTEKESLKAEV